MAAASLGRMSGAAREKLSPGSGARSFGALARSLVLALLLAPVLCYGNGRGETARDQAGPDGDQVPPNHGGSHWPSYRGQGWARDMKRSQCGLPRPEKWGCEIQTPEWVGGDEKWPCRGQNL